MPPKRKAAAEQVSESSTRATRSSGRVSGEKTEPAPKATTTKPKTTKAATKKAKNESGDDQDSEPPAKKAKTTKTKAAPKTKGKKNQTRDEPTESEASQNTKAISNPANDAKARPSSEPYTSARALALFEKYVDADDPTAIGPVGLENLCADANIPMEGAMPLILAWQLGAKEMGRFTKSEWVEGTSNLKISSLPSLFSALSDLNNLLILSKSPVKSNAKLDPYDRTTYLTYTKDTKSAFHKLYLFCFKLAKPEPSRNIDMETSAAIWSVILSPKYPIMQEVLEYLGEKEGVYKATNKDLWTMMLEFCETVDPNLQGYESDEAWPTLLDEFVAWKKAKSP